MIDLLRELQPLRSRYWKISVPHTYQAIVEANNRKVSIVKSKGTHGLYELYSPKIFTDIRRIKDPATAAYAIKYVLEEGRLPDNIRFESTLLDLLDALFG